MTVIQPYVPAYRVPFFNEVDRILGVAGLRLQVVHGAPTGEQASRGDAWVGPWSHPVHDRRVTVWGHALHYRSVLALARHSKVTVTEFASTNLDTYLLAATPGVRLMLWGHGRSYVTAESKIDSRLELALARRAEHVFVYTDGGEQPLLASGYDPSRITVVRNSTDTVTLRRTAERAHRF